MTSVEEKKFLLDVLNSLESINEFLENKRNFLEYKSSKIKQRAVERELEIIGEATRNLLKLNPNIQLSYARIIVDLRNKIIHSYDNINNALIWKIIMKDIPVLEQEVKKLLKD